VISGYSGIFGTGSAVTIVNVGGIAGTGTGANGFGVELLHGGLVSNTATGVITGTGNAVYLNGGASTLVNAGMISGGAVNFHAGFTNRLVVDPGAGFTGTVNGGNAIGATAVSTLELAPGASTGTLTGLGTQFINFAQVTVDVGAKLDPDGQQHQSPPAGH